MHRFRPLSVAVLLDLERGTRAGGHVKSWEHFARAAVDVAEIDLTVYVLGRRPYAESLSDNVRFVALKPVLSTRFADRLVGGVDASDLSPFQPALARRLPDHDLWHATHVFAFASTAARLARSGDRRPLVASVHTDVPTLTDRYVEQVIGGLLAVLGSVARRSGLAKVPGVLARRRRHRVLGACDRVLVANADDYRDLGRAIPGVPLTQLRRGVDTVLFRPDRADRRWLARHHHVPEDRPLVLFVGRVDGTKGATLVAEALRRAGTCGSPRPHLVIAGNGAGTGPITRLLQRDVTLLGNIPQSELARVYASCDLLAFPSHSETVGNVVAEAMSAGIPALLPTRARTAHWLAAPGEDGVFVDADEPDAWSAAITTLVRDPDRLTRMGQRARATIETSQGSWAEVFREDLMSVWDDAASKSPSARASPRTAS